MKKLTAFTIAAALAFLQTSPTAYASGSLPSVTVQPTNLLNVQVVDEMVNMIVAQRAYELNSKAITASDEMLQQANNLRR